MVKSSLRVDKNGPQKTPEGTEIANVFVGVIEGVRPAVLMRAQESGCGGSRLAIKQEGKKPLARERGAFLRTKKGVCRGTNHRN